MRTLTGKVVITLICAIVLTSVAGIMPATSAPGPEDTLTTTIGPSNASISAPVRDLGTPARQRPGGSLPRTNPLPERRGDAGPSTRHRRMNRSTAPAPGLSPAPDLVFDGTGNPQGCGFCSPPDTTGDVGPNNYIQMVNSTKVAIYDKAGVLQTPAFDLSTLFTSGVCSTTDDGDPQVVFDSLADRWVLSQFAANPDSLCFAVSTTADPLGNYYLYEFTMPAFPDYFKVGVWPTGYYVSTNEATYSAYALDRAKMLVGDPATAVGVAGETNFMLPADVDGAVAPSAAGGLFYTFKDDVFHGGQDRLEMFQLTPDFGTPANTTFDTIATIPIQPFTYTVCGFFELDCIPQGGTAQKVDAVSEWPMQRFSYRRFAGRETLVGNFTVGGGSGPAGAAIRWFELDNSGAAWALTQEGTQDPGDGLDRFMGSIAMDGNGNIALGYSASSDSQFPSLRYATRIPSDPPGTLRAEQVLQAGGGSQTASNRWGDYTAMSVDPATDRAFWYTGQYYATMSPVFWSSAIGSFTVFWPQAITFPQPPDVPLNAGTTILAATGGGSGNPVQFTSATPAVCTTGGSNGATVTLVAPGTCTINASQAGNADYSAAAQVQRFFQVTKSPQAISFPQPPDVPLDAGTVTVSATGGGSGNPVQFTSATRSVCTTSGADGATVMLVKAGACRVNADQAGNATFAAAEQVQRSFQVTTPTPIKQRPLDRCVVVPQVIPRYGTTQLLRKKCVTNAGQRVRVTVRGSARALGEVRYWTVIRKTNGAVFLKTRGSPLRVRIHWFAPARGNYLPYSRLERYRTGAR